MLSGIRVHQRTASARGLIALLAICAFLFQAYIVQTHIHRPGENVVVSSAAAHAPLKTPANDDGSDNCPVCQAFALTGAFIAPAVILFPTADAAVEIISTQSWLAGFQPAYRQSWQSRAPPRR